jgi:rare lipoprotein A (peptidoglycan hydrolase)
VQNGKAVVVRVNDRIPEKTKHIAIDLSRASARAIGIRGVGRVALHQLPCSACDTRTVFRGRNSSSERRNRPLLSRAKPQLPVGYPTSATKQQLRAPADLYLDWDDWWDRSRERERHDLRARTGLLGWDLE